MKKIKDFLSCVNIADCEGQLKKRKTLLALFIDVTFLPQVLAAAWIYTSLVYDSYILLQESLQTVLFIIFLQLIIFAILTAVKRFYVSRYLLIFAYLQLVIITFMYGLKRPLMLLGTMRWYYTFSSDGVFTVFSAAGILLTMVNLTAFYGYRKAKEKLTQ